jgi:hypothetical protein
MQRVKYFSDGLTVQDRDLALLRGLFESRVMTAAHIAALYFDCKKIKAAGLISERKRRVNEPSVLFLTHKGHARLTERGAISDFPRLSPTAFEKRADVSRLTIRHELEVMDVKAAFNSALKNSEKFSIAEFSTWPLLHQFRAVRPGHETEVLVKPDGFIRIHQKEQDGGVSEHTFFLEVDRSTETQSTLVNRATCYLDYYKSGGFAVANNALRSAYKEFPFRVLFVLKSAERRNNTAKRLLQANPPIRTFVYLSTFDEVLKNPLGKIWVRPTDYREALGLAAISDQLRQNAYRYSANRQILTKQNIQKLGLFNKSNCHN